MLPFVELGPLRLPVYGLLLCLAILAGVRMAVARAKHYELDAEFVYFAGSLAVLVALLGGKLTDWLIRGGTFSLQHLVTGGGVFLGGFLLAVPATLLAARRAKVPLAVLCDTFAAPLALGVAIVRIGCLAAGCDYGKTTNASWGIVFTDPVAAHVSGVPLGVPLHPTQLYESVLGLFILGAVLWLECPSTRLPLAPLGTGGARPPGTLILAFASVYAVGRFLIEFLRGDADRGFFGPLSTSQWLSLVMLVVFLLVYKHPRLEGS